ncbi:hypothetical protein DVH05_017482 [Phytophthora capsici]|nr:hypothetical protein DVH05_017482 [Phytophthora capsici]
MEIKSLSKAMNESGSFEALWVRSHKEHEVTNDDMLRQRRQSLACVDHAAKTSLQQEMTASYSSWLQFDSFLVLDDEDRPVIGNTLSYLYERANAAVRSGWIARQSHKQSSRRTVTPDEISMIYTEGWTEASRRFYWRARMNLLHTNAVKHRFDARWSDSCVLCDDGCTDTQDHRFGLGDQSCVEVTELDAMLSETYYKLDQQHLLPDQSILIPTIGHHIAMAVGGATREWWSRRSNTQTLWRPIVRIGDGLWAHAQWIEWLGEPAVLASDPLFLVAMNRELHRQAQMSHRGEGCIIPMHLVDAATLTQWVPGWYSATFEDDVPQERLPGLRDLHPQAEAGAWWVEDTFCERSEQWWRRFIRKYERELSDDNPVYWVSTSFGSPGHMHLEAVGCVWLLKVPTGQLRMRTGFSIIQSALHEPYTKVFRSNKSAILIGVIARQAQEIARQSRPIWEMVLTQSYKVDWLILQKADTEGTTSQRQHPVFDWFSHTNDIMLQPRWWTTVRNQLDRRGLTVYDAPMGWKRYPTMTRSSATWSEALMLTSRSAISLHRAVFDGIWATLREYWNKICAKNEIAARRDRDTLLQDVNAGIKARRSQWNRKQEAGIERKLDVRKDQLAARGATWHRRRLRSLEGDQE